MNIETRRFKFASVAIAPVAAFAIACGTSANNSETAPAQPFSGPTRTEFISIQSSDPAVEAKTLNDWLHNQPNNSITSLTTVLNKRNDLYGFEAIVTDTPNKGESCQYLAASTDRTTEGPQAYGAAVLQQFTEQHPGDSIVIVGVPEYHYSDDIGGNGNQGYIVCALPK